MSKHIVKQTPVTPEDLGPKHVFVINDINLLVPPSSINIQQEDLQYTWKTLRTKSSTKIPSGHGHVSVHLSIPFTQRMFLQLHRLITQFRHSPFCYVDNRYLRESIVPDWPHHQNMAFTITGLNIYPLPGSSDTWVCDLDLVWFNYFPYMHNYLFREDWVTAWIRTNPDSDVTNFQKYTIGWHIDRDTYFRGHDPALVGTLSSDGASGSQLNQAAFTSSAIGSLIDGRAPAVQHDRWSVVRGGYIDNSSKTLYDMEAAHAGEEWDLLPLPDNMEPAHIVTQPTNSRIYTRYINLLQRDALLKNFGLDIELQINSLSAIGPEADRGKIWQGLFGVAELGDGKVGTMGLHSSWVPRKLRQGWIRSMARHNYGVRFSFHAFQEIRFPSAWTEKIEGRKQSIVQRVMKTVQLPGSETNDLIVYNVVNGTEDKSDPIYSEPKRNGWFNPIGKHVPVGTSVKHCAEMVSGQQRVHTRGAAEIRRIYGEAALSQAARVPGYTKSTNAYGGGFRHTRIHYGTDFGWNVTDKTIYAVADGIVDIVTRGDNGSAGRWMKFDLRERDDGKGIVGRNYVNSNDQADFESSVQARGWVAEYNPNRSSAYRFKIAGFARYNAVGTFIQSVGNAGVFYFSEYGDGGQQIRIKHSEYSDAAENDMTGTSFSSYMHMATVDPEVVVGGKVVAGQVLGMMGNTSKFGDSYLRHYFNKTGKGHGSLRPEMPTWQDDPDPAGKPTKPKRKFAVGVHLHFEFWESRAVDPRVAGRANGFEPTKTVGGRRSNVVVDIIPSLELAVDQTSRFITETKRTTQAFEDQATIEIEKLQEEGELDTEEGNALAVLLRTLDADGWKYYDTDTTIQNVWQKLVTLNVSNSGIDEVDGLFEQRKLLTQQGVILTNVSGGLRHIVANIPVLSHEYPTQQHLGSTEPVYNLEFAILDDQSNLEGISEAGQYLQGMRSLLQKNSRRFRPITDAWCVSTDTFITRMLGSYRERDILFLQDEAGLVIDTQTRKRTVINRSAASTVEGQPGLSMLHLEVQETNPYEQETLNATAPQLPAKEEARRQILQAVYKLDFVDKYGKHLLPIFLAQQVGANTSRPGDLDYGTFELETYDEAGLRKLFYMDGPQMNPWNHAGIVEMNGEKYVLVEDTTGSLGDIYEALGLAPVSASDFGLTIAQVENQFYRIPLGSLDIPFGQGAADADGNVVSTNGVSVTKNPSGWFVRDQSTVDISKMLEANPELGQIPVDRIRDYYVTVHQLVLTANRMLAEVEAGGFDETQVRDRLYGLPIVNSMWQSFQVYTQATIGTYSTGSRVSGYDAGAAVGRLTHHNNWVIGDSGWQSKLADGEKPALQGLADVTWATAGTEQLTHIIGVSGAAFETIFAAPFLSSITTAQLPLYMHSAALNAMVRRYMINFPMLVSVPEWVKGEYNYLFGDLLGDFMSGENKVAALESMNNQFFNNLNSCGNITALALNGNAHYQMAVEDPWTVSRNQHIGDEAVTSKRVRRGGVLGAAENLGAPVAQAAIAFVDTVSFGHADLIASQDYLLKLTGTKDLLAPDIQVGKDLNSPFQYPTTAGGESLKIKYLQQVISVIADDMLQDIGLLKAFGLVELALQDSTNIITGSECYPDLDLPTHPYYGDSFSTSPDFYMWNIYSDGHAMSNEDQEEIDQNVASVIKRCHASMTKLQDPERNKHKQDTDLATQEVGVDDPIQMSTQMSPEGTDSDKNGESMATPFHPDERSAAAVAVFEGRNVNESTNGAEINSLTPKGIRLSSTEGAFGEGGGVHYPTRASAGVYEQLRNKLKKLEADADNASMFGNQAGYAGELIDDTNTPEIASGARGTKVERPDEYAHQFDVNALIKLAKDSAKDLASQKMSMKRAYPTFKLFFVEEDQFETRLLNFDDFYSYNNIKDFTIVMNRKMPADHAVITLQNVAGTLDGTRRNAIVDLDYLDETAGKKLEAGTDVMASAMGGNPTTQGTAQDQPFGAVVLRPGLNVQLRTGFSNDPDNLHVMISGRVVDVTWNKSGDLAEIMVQSFGAELVQAIKGTNRSVAPTTYHTTHELLGSLMLEPEVVHFGRWEFGQLFQYGEASDYRLDFHDYSKEGFMGRFKATNALTGWFGNHPWLTFAGALGLTAAQFFPMGRVFGSGRLGAAVVAKAGLGSARGVGGWGKAFITAAGEGAELGTKLSAGGSRGAALAASLSKGMAATYNVAAKVGAGHGSTTFIKMIATQKEQIGKLVAKGLQRGATIGEIAEDAAKLERYFQTAAFKGQWMAKPWMDVTIASFTSSVGTQPAYTAFWTMLNGPPKLVLGAAVTGLALDGIMNFILEPAYSGTIGRVKRFFQTTQAHLFLSPQDDNLFPPHPKDYMTLDRSRTAVWAEAMVTGGSRYLFQDDTAGQLVFRFFTPSEFLSKKVSVSACEYQLITTTTWDVLHEMTLRHPGWIYAVRPYGNKLRYTMFFGVPSQRYWSKPASNRFIHRINELRRYLYRHPGSHGGDSSVNQQEFISLYGQDTFDALKEQVESRAQEAFDTLPLHKIGTAAELELNNKAEIREEITGGFMRTAMTSIPLKEYLRGLQVRFVPFRRYHMLTSERDIVWNGIMSSEQAVVNAFDVTYVEDHSHLATDTAPGKVASALFKAHAFIPEHQIRSAPLRYPNCKSYPMAMRYGMGALLHSMRDMYRGEIIVLGNPRLRPWDIGIVIDSYNDMVGPIEIEQVVHTMSHETGYITEIKPSAVVIGNEISSWPMIEAMKTMALAVQDIENSFGGQHGEISATQAKLSETGSLSGLADFLASWGGEEFNSFIDEKYKRDFPEGGARLRDIFGDNPPGSKAVDDLANDATSALSTSAFITGNGLAVAGALTSIAGTLTAGSLALSDDVLGAGMAGITGVGAPTGKEIVSVFAKSPRVWVGGAAVIAGLGLTVAGVGITAASTIDFPGLAWLVGGPILFLHCLRNEAIIVVPLIKNGNPIVSGLAYNDPSMIWNNFRGDLNRWADDTITGTRDMTALYSRYGTSLWSRMWDPYLGEMTGENTAAQSSPLQ